MAVLAGLTLLITPPLALGFSAAGLRGGDRKWYTLVTLLISGILTLLIVWSFLSR